jgi:ribonuclease P protein component
MPASISNFSKSDVKKLFNNVKKRLSASGLVFIAAPKSGATAKILVITSRKSGSAAKRNRIRRRLKSVFFEHKLFLKTFDIAVIVKKEGIDNSFKRLEQILTEFVNATNK